MKYIGLIILFCLFSFRISAQNEIPADSVRSMDMSETKEFDGFLLDMNLMKMASMLCVAGGKRGRKSFSMRSPEAVASSKGVIGVGVFKK